MLPGASVQRVDHIRALADRLGTDVLIVDDLRDGWPALCRIKVGDEWVRVALHVGTIGLSQRGRDDRERRFQNPSQNKPLTCPPGYRPALVGMAYGDGGEIVALAGMEAEKRLGKPTRFSLFIPSESLACAEQRGWQERRSTTGEMIRIAHPALLPVLIAVDEVLAPVPAIGRAIAAAGIQLSASTPAQEAEARQCGLRAAERAVFEQRVRRAYEDDCALCEGNEQATHVFVFSQPEALRPPELSDALPLCEPHHRAFEQHQLYVDPASRSVRIGPQALVSGTTEPGPHIVAQSTRETLGAPADGRHAVGAEELLRHYRQYPGQYTWATQPREEPIPLVGKERSSTASEGGAQGTPVKAGREATAMVELGSSRERTEDTQASDSRALLSSDAIGSIEGVAELLLTSPEAKQSLILRGRIMAADEENSPSELLRILAKRDGNRLALRKLIDSQPASVVIHTLSNVIWIGERHPYAFAAAEESPTAMREAVLCLTRLVLAQLETGASGVDSVADASNLLRPTKIPEPAVDKELLEATPEVEQTPQPESPEPAVDKELLEATPEVEQTPQPESPETPLDLQQTDLLDRARSALLNAEAALQQLTAEAAASGRYDELNLLADCARLVGAIGKSVGAGEPPEDLASSRKRRRGKRAASPYPKFSRSGDQLIKTSWSKKNRSEYEHKAHREALTAVVDALSQAGAEQHPVQMDQILPIPSGEGDEMPTYQAYLTLSFLGKVGIVSKVGRSGYQLTEPAHKASEAAQRSWERLDARD